MRVIAGVDEAGRGPLAGPVVAAAVILPSGSRVHHRHGKPHRFCGVRIGDSKVLTPLQRRRAYDVILARAIVGVGIVPAGIIDERNIRQATLQAMQDAVAGLARMPDLVLVDGNDPPPLPMPCQTMIGGDGSSAPIACASIVAKVVRDSLMAFYHQLFPAYGFDRHKGYGTTSHLEALHAHGPSPLHRLSFQPVSGMGMAPCSPFDSGKAGPGNGWPAPTSSGPAIASSRATSGSASAS